MLKHVPLKHEGENPTGSFKDRGTTCGAAVAKFYGAQTVDAVRAAPGR